MEYITYQYEVDKSVCYLRRHVCKLFFLLPILVTDLMYDCVVLIFQWMKKQQQQKKGIKCCNVIFHVCSIICSTSQGHHCSPLLFAKNAEYLQTENCLCTYWRISNFVNVYVTLW